MKKPPILSINDITLPEADDVTFDQFNQADDRERWRGRASLMELSEGGDGGAGGNADNSGDPIDTYHEKHRGDTLITGPSDVTGKGSKPHA